MNFPTVTKLTITGYVASNPSAIPSPVLPSGTQFVAYTQLVVFVGGATPYSCAVTGLPMGLTLNPTFTATPTGGYCTLSGTPQVFGSFPLVFNITDSSIPPEIATNNTVTLVINPAFGFTGYTMGPGEVGVPYSQNFTFTGGNPNYTCSIPANGTAGGLPVGTGLSMNSAPTGLNCVLAGTPTAADAAAPINIVVSVMDSASGGSPATTATTNTLGMPPVVTINPHLALSAPLVLGTGEQNVPYMQTISTTGGIAPLTVCSFAPALPAGLTTMISGSNCTIMGTPTVAFAPTLLTLTATDSGSPNTAGMMGTINPKPTSNLTILAQTSLSAFTLGTGQAGSMYNQLVAFTGGNAPYNCSETGLPPGTGLAVTVSGMNCQLSGMPTAQDVAASPMNVMITVTDTPPSASSTAPGTSTQSSAFTVLAQLVLNPFTLLAGEAGAMYSQALPFTGGNAPFTCTGAGFPVGTGLAVTTVANTCVVSGTPTAQDATASPQTIMVTVKDTAPSGSSQQGSSTQSSSLTIYTALTITVTLGNGEVNSAYSSDPAVNPGAVEPAISGGNPAATTYTCTFVPVPPAPSPISGLNVTWNGKPAGAGPGCTVSGTPTAAFGFPAAATIQLQVTEGQAPSTSSQAGVSVPATSNAITIFPALNLALTLGSGEVNAAYATTNPGATEPSISGGMTSIGTTTYTCAFVGAFPPGLSSAVPPLSPVWNGMTGANAGCTVQGTPTAPFGFPVAATTQVKVTESPAPSNYSAAGTFTATSNPISIFPALSLAATLGNGEVMAAYSSDPAVNPGAVEPAISGGNPAVTTYICAFTGTSPAGLNAVWNGSTGAAAGCTVSGTPSGTFGFPAAASSTIQVTEGQAPGNYSAAGSFTATSNAITIYPQVALDPFTLGDGETNAGYSHTGINVTAATGSPGAPPPQSYTCSSSNLPTGLTASAVGASCQVTGTPTATNAASVTVMVTENVRPSAYSVPGSNTRASTGNLNIFPGVTFNSAMFSLGNGAVDQV
ncbi:MAG TPA: hypothetical protein VL099_16510, partial [Candidatus Binatia bacterium]|nr:hypothetical protein [Candidatus Binatia bacterium]